MLFIFILIVLNYNIKMVEYKIFDFYNEEMLLKTYNERIIY